MTDRRIAIVRIGCLAVIYALCVALLWAGGQMAERPLIASWPSFIAGFEMAVLTGMIVAAGVAVWKGKL